MNRSRQIALTAMLIALATCGCQTASVEEQLNEMAGDLNKRCPQMKNDFTRLDRVEVDSPNSMTFTFTVLGDASKEFTEESMNFARQEHCRMYEADDRFEFARRNKVSITYVYLDDYGNEVFSTTAP